MVKFNLTYSFKEKRDFREIISGTFYFNVDFIVVFRYYLVVGCRCSNLLYDVTSKYSSVLNKHSSTFMNFHIFTCLA